MLMLAVALLSMIASARAAETLIPMVPRTTLPEDHDYQRTLRKYLGTLSAKDFDHAVTEKFTAPPIKSDVEEQYRHWLLGKFPQPLFGTKRGIPAVNAPAHLFTLAAIETPQGVMRPPLWPEPVAFLVSWNYPGNPYHKSRAMKLRAFVTMCVQMLMLDDQLEHAPEAGGNRSDWLTAPLILLAHPYPAVRDVLPEPVRQAYETGLRKMGRRVLDWGPKGEEPNLDLIAPVALWYASQALHDAKFTEETTAAARQLFTDQRYFHPAGYFVDRGGIDLGYGGQSNFFATWAALASGWPFAKEAVERCYRLRSHVCLPEPDGKFIGPSHFQTRYSADAWRDQWDWGDYRNTAAALLTDEAVYLTKLPTPEVLSGAVANRAKGFQAQLNENHKTTDGKGFLRNDEIKNAPWLYRRWQSWHFPGPVNFAYELCPPGAFAHRQQLEQDQSPLLKSPFQRADLFVREFDKTFVVTKQLSYSAILHTGSVGGQQLDDGLTILPGPYGFGGGQLSAFWTPATGSVLLGRRGGMTREKNFDQLEDWRQWPIHAVSGARSDGKVFTTARIRQPHVTTDLADNHNVVRVTGVIPQAMLGQPKVLEGHWQYTRTFTLGRESLQIETIIKSTGQDTIAELYETLPVFLRETAQQPKATPTTIEFQIENNWSPARTAWSNRVTAVRLTRFDGAVLITFDRARRVKLSPADWTDTYLSRASCRNVLIDLLENKDQPQVLRAASVRYQIQPTKKP